MNGRKVLLAMRNLAHILITRGGKRVRALAGRLGRRPTCSPTAAIRAAHENLPRLLRRFNDDFIGHHEQTDIQFVQLAKSLRGVYQIAQDLAVLVGERLGAIRTALNESRITGANGLATASLQDLRDGLTETAGELTTLQAVGRALQRLHTQVKSVEKIGLSIRISVFGFALESARTDQCQQVFGAFVAELRTLGDRITHLATAIDDQAGATRRLQQQEWSTLTAGHVQLCQLAKQVEATAGAAAAEAEAMLNQVLAGLQDSAQRMDQVTHHAGEAVFYLQFGDIVRQKTEHIAAALREIAIQLDQAAATPDFGARAQAAHQIILIQIDQLKLIQAEVAAAQHQLAGSFQALATETAQLRETFGHWHTGPDRSGPEANSLAAFKAELRRLEQLHREGQVLRQDARRTTQQAVAASHQLAGHVNEVKALNADIHLQALNAIVKTAALGDQGATLSVLAMHVDSLYGESRNFVTELVGILESVIQQPHTNPRLTESADLRLQAGMEQIEAAFNACGSTFTSADQLVEQQRGALAGSQELLGFLADHGVAIGGQIQELTTFQELLVPWMTGPTDPTTKIESLHQRYTMQSERDIHHRISGTASTCRSGATNDNVDVFETSQRFGAITATAPASSPQASPESQSASPSATAGPDANVELF